MTVIVIYTDMHAPNLNMCYYLFPRFRQRHFDPWPDFWV